MLRYSSTPRRRENPRWESGEMPSEKIYGTGDIDTRVAWGSGKTVQVATLVRETTEFDPTERIIKIVNEWLEAAGEPKIDLAKLREKITEGRPYFDGYHASLTSWTEVNALIRVLKRARDAAFGRPE